MVDFLKKGKALVILGNQGSGKTTRAIKEAENIGTFSITTIDKLYTSFSLGEILSENPQVVIVEECSVTILDDPQIKKLVSTDKLVFEKRGENPRTVPNIRWIFTVCLVEGFL